MPDAPRGDRRACRPAWCGDRGRQAEALYRGYRVPGPEARRAYRRFIDTGLNRLDDDLERGPFIAGAPMTMADIMLDAFVTAMAFGVRWLDTPARRNLAAWRADGGPSVGQGDDGPAAASDRRAGRLRLSAAPG